MKLDEKGVGALFIIVLLVVLAGAGFYLYKNTASNDTIASYDDCVAANGLIQESYPEVCVIDGHNFPNPNQSLQKP